MEQMIVPILPVLCVIFAVLAVLYLVLDGKQSRQTVRKAAKPDSTRTSAPERPVNKSRKKQPKPKKPLPVPPKPEPEELPTAAPKPEPEELPAAAPKPEPEELPTAAPKPEPEELPTAAPKPEPEKAAAVSPKHKPKRLSAASPKPERKKPTAVRQKPEPEKTQTSAPEQVLPEMPAETQESSPEQTEEKRIFRILTHDPAFAADDFKAYAVSCFRRLQAVHRLEDMPAIRGFVGETFYLRKRSDLAMSFLSDDAPALPEETVQSCVIIGDMIRNGKEYLIVSLKAGEDAENVKHYRMVFARQEGIRTLSAMPLSAFRCPSCGKALSVDIVGICNECGVCVADGSQYWLLERMESE